MASPPSVRGALAAGARVLDGRALARAWAERTAARVRRLVDAGGPTPGLGVVLVGDRPDSALYVRRKREACERAGVAYREAALGGDARQDDVVAAVRRFGADPTLHGVLVQLPLPRHLDQDAVLDALDWRKDVDGFHPLNVGRLAMRSRSLKPWFVPCTPKGCIELLSQSGVCVEGKSAVVLGDSNTVGQPLAWLLRDAGAACVTVCHHVAGTEVGHWYRGDLGGSAEGLPLERPRIWPLDLPAVCRGADVIVAAVGRRWLVRDSWLKPGAVVLDAGINAVPAGEGNSDEHGTLNQDGEFYITGDVHFDEACRVAGAVTPVPGGLGPMTIAALLENVAISAERLHALEGRGDA